MSTYGISVERARNIIADYILKNGVRSKYDDDGESRECLVVEFTKHKRMHYANDDRGNKYILCKALIHTDDIDEGFEDVYFADEKFELVLEDINILDEDLIFVAENMKIF